MVLSAAGVPWAGIALISCTKDSRSSNAGIHSESNGNVAMSGKKSPNVSIAVFIHDVNSNEVRNKQSSLGATFDTEP